MTTLSLLACVAMSIAGGCKTAKNPPRWPDQDPSVTHPDMIVVGDSIMANWHNDGPFLPPNMQVLDHAIGGQRLSTIWENLREDVFVYHPRALLVEGGINDLMAGWNADQINQWRLEIVSSAKQAGIKVYLATMTPYDPTRCGPSTEDGNAVVAQVNATSKAACSAGMCTLVDFNTAMGGTYNPSLYKPNDCVHPNASGNARLTSETLSVYP